MYQVYVVDDDQFILEEVVNTIPWLDNGFEVIGSNTSPIIAMEEIKIVNPDLVFCDLKMPMIDGIDMMKELTKQGVQCEYVMLSAFASFSDSRRFFLENGFDYLLKPLKISEVQILLERLSEKLAKKKPVQLEINSKISPAFLELLDYIDSHYIEKHTLEGLSERFHLSANYICNLFSTHYNTTLTRYVTKKRMELAANKIVENSESFKEIALDCGYADYYYFCKVFKEFYSVPPSVYMRNVTQGGQQVEKE